MRAVARRITAIAAAGEVEDQNRRIDTSMARRAALRLASRRWNISRSDMTQAS
jgi:hypothetical protein